MHQGADATSDDAVVAEDSRAEPPPPPDVTVPEPAPPAPVAAISKRAHTTALIIVGVGVVAFVATRWLLRVYGIGNPDIAGILYSADRIGEGFVPYRDTSDIKPPGTFFLVAAAFRLFGRGLPALHVFYGFWVAAGAPAVALAADALYRRDPRARDDRSVVAGAIAAGLYLLSMGEYDMNYASWMTPLYAWSFAMLVIGLRRRGFVAPLLAGAFAALAFLFKSQSVVLAPCFLVLWAWARRRGERGATLPALGLWVVGALVAVAPLSIFYASKGGFVDLARSVFPFETVRAYSARRGLSLADVSLLWRVPKQQLAHFRLELALAGASIAGARWARTNAGVVPSFVPGLVFYGASIVGCGLGGLRFYTHYLPQCLPALAILGAHPAALDWLAEARGDAGARWVVRGARVYALMTLVVALYMLGRIPFGRASSLEIRGSAYVRKTGKYIRLRTTSDDRIVVWGWTGWGTYYFADRRSPSPMFKMLGDVTEFNDNSIVSKGTRIHFRPGPNADQLMRDLTATPPAFIVRANPFFPAIAGDPLDDFTAFRELVERDYIWVKKFGNLDIYERRERRGMEKRPAKPRSR